MVLALGLGLGFWLGQGHRFPGTIEPVTTAKPLYYRHPMNASVTSPTPSKDEMGMDYVPVYAEPTPPVNAPANGKILYYRHPMGAADTSPIPKKDEMGMDYLPVYEGEQVAAGQLQLTPEKIQKLGVKTEPVTKRVLSRNIKVLGSIQIDESRVYAVTPKFEGWVKRLYVNTTGAAVKTGQPLLEIYSPELMTAQQEYLIAKQSQQALQKASPQAQSTAKQLTDSALQRLHYWDIAPAQLRGLQTQAKPLDSLPLLAPVHGVVIDKPAQQGMRFMPGELLFRIADLSSVWLLAEVFEQDIAGVHLGQRVQVAINAYPDRQFVGKIGFIYPTLATETRTVKVRVELANSHDLLKPGLFGSVNLTTQQDNQERLVVSESAVIDSGIRQIVLRQRGAGLFEPKEVKLGLHANGYWEVLSGLELGDEVVTRANFLLDAESNLKSVLDSLGSANKEIAIDPMGDQ